MGVFLAGLIHSGVGVGVYAGKQINSGGFSFLDIRPQVFSEHNLVHFIILLEFFKNLYFHPELVIFGEFRHEQDCFPTPVVDQGQTVSLLHPEQVPKRRLLLN